MVQTKINKKGEFKIIAKIIVVLISMFIIISIISSTLIEEVKQFEFCEDSIDWDEDGNPDRMDNCVCRDKSKCDDVDSKLECMNYRNEKLGCKEIEN
jgi:hypothetical protein